VRTSLEIADILRAAGPAYHAAQAEALSLRQLKVMSAIEHCRTAALGGHVEACVDSGQPRPRPRPSGGCAAARRRRAG
jgi:hypothetical protein